MKSLDLFRTMIVFVESANIHEAAKSLNVTQPTVTQHLKLLESQFERPLFTIKGKKKVLTSFGKAIYTEAKEGLNSFEAKITSVDKRFQDIKKRHLKIGGRREVLTRLLSKSVFPGKVSFLSMPSQNALEALEEHKIDIAITHHLTSKSEIFCHKLWDSPYGLVVHKDLWPQSEIPRPSDLCQYPYTSYFLEDNLIQKWAQKNSFDHLKLIQGHSFDDWETVFKLVRKEKSWAIAPIDYTFHKDLRIFPIKASVLAPMSFYALYDQDIKNMGIKRIFSL